MKKWQIVLLIVVGLATLCLLGIAGVFVMGMFQVANPPRPEPVVEAASPIPLLPDQPIQLPAATHNPGPTVTALPTSIHPTFTMMPTASSIPSLTPIIPGVVISGSVPVPATCIPDQNPETGVVANVIDAENIEVVISGTLFQVHYLGIDAPEDEPYGERAVLLNRTMVFGQTVSLYKDQSDKDLNGRLLRYVIFNNRFVNGELIQQGMAQSNKVPPDTSCAVEFERLQAAAQLARAGIWRSVLTPTAPTAGEPEVQQ